MPLDFPSSPVDGQIYDNYVWSAAGSVWQLLGNVLEVPAVFTNTPTGSYTDGYDYEYVTFNSSGTLNVTRGGYADILLVGGGGGGAKPLLSGFGLLGVGGGGAGGVLYIENAYLPAGSLDVVVGTGGIGGRAVDGDEVATGGIYIPSTGNSGLPSSLGKYFVPGGGAGGIPIIRTDGTAGMYSGPGFNGGSGGGASGAYNSGGDPRIGGLGVSGIGNNGGGVDASSSSIYAGAGGGGAGAAGSTVSGTGTGAVGGNGGNGIANSITGTSVTYGGGGGGSGQGGNGTGGTGGGGAAGNPPGDGTANTGGGGGASSLQSVAGGAGGSGIVIVRVRTN